MLVGTWLCGIGLEYAVPTFEAAGIVTPDALGELNPAHFEALGVQHPDDRRKLFYLVQRVKQQQQKQVQQQDQQQQQQQHGVQSAAASAATAPSVTVAHQQTKESSKLHSSRSRRQPSQQQQPQSGEDDNSNDQEEEEGDVENGTTAVNVMFPHHHPHGTSSSRRSLSHGGTAQHHPPPRGRLSGVPIPKKRSSSSGGSSTSTATGSAGGAITVAAAAPPTATTAAPPLNNYSGRSRGKPLSTIPSHASAPMSPLVDWNPVDEPDDDNDDDDDAVVSRNNNSPSMVTNPQRRRSTRRAHSVGGETTQCPDNHEDNDQAATLPPTTTTIGAPLSRDNSNHNKQAIVSRSSVGAGARQERRSTRGQSLQGSNGPLPGNEDNSSDRNGSALQQEVVSQAIAATAPCASLSSSSSSASSSFAAQIQRLWEDNARAHGPVSPASSPSPTAAIVAGQRVSVVVRKRPATHDVDVLQCLHPHQLLVYQPRTRVDLRREITALPFTFDAVVSEHATNVTLYQSVVRPLVPNLLGGQCATVFCFGQTGSGKTHTLFGCRSPSTNTEATGGEEGLYLLAARDVFSTIRALPDFCVTAGLFELYDRKVLDLLANRVAVPCWEDATGRVQFPGLSWHDVGCAEDLQRLVEQGNALRSTGTTSTNSDSSRSHAILQLQLDQLQGSPPGAMSSHPGKKRKRHRYATMTFIDLAGSERGADTALFSNATRMEGAEINTSLLALKEVLRAMSSDSAHIPFRGSKLTQVLKESLVEATSTCVMIACVSPHLSHCEPTLNTLRYAQCLKDFEKSKDLSGRTTAPPQPQVTLHLPPKPICDAPQLQSAPSPTAKLDAIEKHDTHRQPPTNASHHIKSNSVHSEISNDDSALLDEILSSPASVVNDTPPMHLPDRRREAAQQLFLTHKDAMTAMLSMVKEEMAIVCNHSGDNPEATVRYMDDVKAIQDRQLHYIVKLREHLLQFYEAGNAALDHSNFHNESFEDLRD